MEKVNKKTAILLYINGLPLRTIAKLLKVSNVSVLNWVRKYTLKNYEKPAPKGETVIVELDEMWHFIKSKKNKLWIWKAYNRTDKKLIDWECGKRDKCTLLKLIERLKRWNVDIYFSDKWEAYREVIPNDKLKQTKSETYRIESNNAKQRHWLARFRRRTCVVSQSIQMVDSTMMLFAKFFVNGYFNYTTLFS